MVVVLLPIRKHFPKKNTGTKVGTLNHFPGLNISAWAHANTCIYSVIAMIPGPGTRGEPLPLLGPMLCPGISCPDPNVDRHLCSVRRGFAAMKSSGVFFSVGMAIIEYNRSVRLRAHLQIESGKGGVPSPLVRERVEINQHCHMAVTLVKVFLEVTRLHTSTQLGQSSR